MIYLEVPKNLKLIVNQAHQVAKHVFRPISRKYDRAEHDYPKELDMLAALMDGLSEGGGQKGAGIDALQRDEGSEQGVRNGANMSTCLGMTELCWGDVGLALSIPRQGLGNAAITAVADTEQKKRFRGVWAAMAITEPGAGSDSANIRTTARLDGDEWVLDGEKNLRHFGQPRRRGGRLGNARSKPRALGDQVVRRAARDPRHGGGSPRQEDGHPRVGHGQYHPDGLSHSKENLLGTSDIDAKKGFSGVMQTFDNTRPVVAAMGVGVARAALEHTRELLEREGVKVVYRGPLFTKSAVEAELIVWRRSGRPVDC